jgi:Cys-tRNA(Pro)/Cys-tRNA(Cys) deacylase
MPQKLNSMRILEQHKIPYEVVEFPDTMRDAEEIAEVLGIAPHMVYKTLVVEPVGVPGAKSFLALIAADRTLDLKRMAMAAGYKKVGMAAHKDAERLTGLQVGGISALALMHKNWAVYIDQPATQLEHILVSAGQRGCDLRVPTTAFIQLVRAKVADVSMP